ncbi:hypothetical protein Tsubulata_034188 [Turnera subulata]|uniref:Kinesin motor domain-containing protein n=1 Tax=Turnera subulata TaxID=218843 RepID=A0A9Q0F3T9_9ROSI|nr:hypothetical protein Tsubulata_034188 [Turnera subulata]
MEFGSPPSCPPTVTVRRNPHRRARPTPSTNLPLDQVPSKPQLGDICSFPIDDILSIQIPETAGPSTENLKVYLRIRPLPAPPPAVGQNRNSRNNKNVWPQNPKNTTGREKTSKKKSSGTGAVCLSPIDSQSVTLSPPLALKESRRIKAEVYGGFSQVFPSASSQDEVYEKMVKTMVDEFLEGKSGMLAAVGPSGSGKTHTVFGTNRHPGMVPLALRHIFKRNKEACSKLTRSFSLSIFEISSERGKVERISDLTSDGIECSMQQSTIKGLQEVPISDAAQAEALIACALLKRATATTNSNSHSSRSQCVINIHTVVNGKLQSQTENSVLTIVDLAGAEREKKTGNQGSRLLESNFINNTSMVFGLCLRSLLEHQKNPKKPLQKHFQGSLLTRYLRDYLEGKKRMALILTVRPGEEDYHDTNYLLRQASPFMQIKFNNTEESSSLVPNKRQMDMLSRAEQAKRMKSSDLNVHEIEDEKSVGNKTCHMEKGTRRIYESDFIASASKRSDSIDSTGERNHQIMQNVAKALWNVLKQYKEKVTVAEREIQRLNENLGNEKTRSLALEEEIEELKSRCTCFRAISKETMAIDHSATLQMSECISTPECGSKVGKDLNASPQMIVINHVANMKMSESITTAEKCDSNTETDLVASFQMISVDCSPNLKMSKCTLTPGKCVSNPERDVDAPTQMIVISASPSKATYKSISAPGNCGSNTRRDLDANLVHHPPKPKTPESISTPEKCGSDIGSDVDTVLQVIVSSHSPNQNMSEGIQTHGKCCSNAGRDPYASLQVILSAQSPSPEMSECDKTPEKCDFVARTDLDACSEINVSAQSPSPEMSECNKTPEKRDFVACTDLDASSEINLSAQSPSPEMSECDKTPEKCDFVACTDLDASSEMDANVQSTSIKASQCNGPPMQDLDVPAQEPLDQPLSSKQDAESSKRCSIDVPDSEAKLDSVKSLILQKPKRRLLPASSVLLRDITTSGFEDEPDKRKQLMGQSRSRGTGELRNWLQMEDQGLREASLSCACYRIIFIYSSTIKRYICV